MILFNLLLLTISVWLIGSALYVFTYAVSGFFYRQKDEIILNDYPKTVVFIPKISPSPTKLISKPLICALSTLNALNPSL